MEKVMIRCDNCIKRLPESNFYKNITEKLNRETGEYESFRICKECFISEFLRMCQRNTIGLHRMCQEYNLYYNCDLVKDTISKNSKSRETLVDYIRIINSLQQYKDKKYKDSVFEEKEKSDIDFINEDINKLKQNIEKAIQKEDFNAHNKWMNCLRDAIELREKLDDKSKWKEFSSHYYEGNESIKGENEYISLWEQNGNDDIRNHRIFKVEKEIKKPTHIALYSNILKLSANDNYSTIQIPLPNSIQGISEDKLLLMINPCEEKYEANETSYWKGCYGKIKDGFVNISAINTIINKDNNERYNKDITIEYRIWTENK